MSRCLSRQGVFPCYVRHMSGNDVRGRAPLSLVSQEPDLLFYMRQAGERGGPVLVLGAANGRVPWSLAGNGVQAVGVDASEAMVRSAEERRNAESPEVSARVRFVVSDVRALRLEERFALVLAPQHAMGLMPNRDDLEAFLATVRHHLAPDGTFIYDVLNPPREAILPRDDTPTAPLEPRRSLFALHLSERKPPGGPAPIRRLRLRHFSPEELETALSACGLTLRERYGRFDGKPFDLEDSRQIGVVGL
jgi:SAM-dependent methyltransferase